MIESHFSAWWHDQVNEEDRYYEKSDYSCLACQWLFFFSHYCCSFLLQSCWNCYLWGRVCIPRTSCFQLSLGSWNECFLSQCDTWNVLITWSFHWCLFSSFWLLDLPHFFNFHFFLSFNYPLNSFSWLSFRYDWLNWLFSYWFFDGSWFLSRSLGRGLRLSWRRFRWSPCKNFFGWWCSVDTSGRWLFFRFRRRWRRSHLLFRSKCFLTRSNRSTRSSLPLSKRWFQPAVSSILLDNLFKSETCFLNVDLVFNLIVSGEQYSIFNANNFSWDELFSDRDNIESFLADKVLSVLLVLIEFKGEFAGAGRIVVRNIEIQSSSIYFCHPLVTYFLKIGFDWQLAIIVEFLSA